MPCLNIVFTTLFPTPTVSGISSIVISNITLTIFPEDGGIIGVVGVSVSSPPLTGGIEGTSGSCGVLGSLGTIPVALYCA